MAVPIPSVCPGCRPTPGARCRSTQRPRGSAVRAGLAAPIRSRQMGRRRRRRKWPRRRRLGHRSGRVAGPSTPAARRAGWRCRAGQPRPSALRPGRRPASLVAGAADSAGEDEAVTGPGDSGLHARDLGRGSRKLSPSAGCRIELRHGSRRRWSWADGRRSAGHDDDSVTVPLGGGTHAGGERPRPATCATRRWSGRGRRTAPTPGSCAKGWPHNASSWPVQVMVTSRVSLAPSGTGKTSQSSRTGSYERMAASLGPSCLCVVAPRSSTRLPVHTASSEMLAPGAPAIGRHASVAGS